MDRFTSDLMDKTTAKLNPVLMRGYAVVQLKYVVQYYDNVIRMAADSFPPGLVYVGIERISPSEEYLRTIESGGRYAFEVQSSDIYQVKLKFTYEGVALPDYYVYLPYVGEGGIMHISGTPYSLSPVITDRVVTIDEGKVFTRLLRNKFFIYRFNHSVKVNGITENLPVIWPMLYHGSPNMKAGTKVTTISLYLLGKLGFNKTFEKYGDVTPITGHCKDVTTEKYPDHIVLTASGLVPKCYKKASHYKSHQLAIAIPKDKWNNNVKHLATGVMYTLDLFPEMASEDMFDDAEPWRLIMSFILFNRDMTMDKLIRQVDGHFESLDHCLDQTIIQRLAESGYIVEDFYDWLAVCNDKFTDWMLNRLETSVIYNRYLDVNYYVMYELTASIIRICFSFNKATMNNAVLTYKDVDSIIRGKLLPGTIYQLVKTTDPNLCVSSIQYSGDSLYPKITSGVKLQEHGEGVRRKKSKRHTVTPADYIDGSDLSIGSLLYLPKGTPTPLSRINIFAEINPATGNITPSDEMRSKLEQLGHTLKQDASTEVTEESFVGEILDLDGL